MSSRAKRKRARRAAKPFDFDLRILPAIEIGSAFEGFRDSWHAFEAELARFGRGLRSLSERRHVGAPHVILLPPEDPKR